MQTKRRRLPLDKRLIKAHRTSKGLTIIRGSERTFVQWGSPTFVRLIGYLGIKEDEMVWIPVDSFGHMQEILSHE